MPQSAVIKVPRWRYLNLFPLSGSSESGRGQPHSKTLARATQPGCFRKVLECGCPLPLFLTANIGERTTSPLRSSISYPLWLRLCRAVSFASLRFLSVLNLVGRPRCVCAVVLGRDNLLVEYCVEFAGTLPSANGQR